MCFAVYADSKTSLVPVAHKDQMKEIQPVGFSCSFYGDCTKRVPYISFF